MTSCFFASFDEGGQLLPGVFGTDHEALVTGLEIFALRV